MNTVLMKIVKPFDEAGFHFAKGQLVELEPSAARLMMHGNAAVPAEPAERLKHSWGGREPGFGNFLKALAARAPDAMLGAFYDSGVAHKALTESSGVAGGYIVPPRFADALRVFDESSFIGPRAWQFRTSSKELLLPLIDMTTAQAAGTTPFFGGLKLSWFGEGAQPPESESMFKQVSFVLNYLGGLVTVNNSWLADSAPFTTAALLTGLFGRALAWFEEYAFLRGNGVGQPLGILNAACTIDVARQTANEIGYADVATILSKLLPESINRAFWLFHPTAQPQLLQMKDGPGRAALVQVGASAAGLTQWSLAGLPAYATEKLPALGTAGDLVLIDPTFYAIADWAPAEALADTPPNNVPTHSHYQGGGATAPEPRRSFPIVRFSSEASQTTFVRNQSHFLIAQRCDGQPVLDKAVTLQDGSTQVSPFVVLQ